MAADDCIKVLDLQGRLQFMSEGGKRSWRSMTSTSLQGCPWPDFGPVMEILLQTGVENAAEGKSSYFVGDAKTAKPTTNSGSSGYSGLCEDETDVSPVNFQGHNGYYRCQKRNELLTQELQHRIKIPWPWSLPCIADIERR